jgi:hypothetical protein
MGRGELLSIFPKMGEGTVKFDCRSICKSSVNASVLHLKADSRNDHSI